MTQKGDLWDDSALVNAFDHAVSKYKMMHVGENFVTSTEENIPADNGSNELIDLQATNENYDELLNKYYEVEEQRQKILEKLNQFVNPVSSTFTTSQEQNQTCYDTTACYCPYGCQNWTVPCSGVDQNCSKGGENDKSKSTEDTDFDTMAMSAVERALRLVTKECSSNDDGLENGECKKSPTDLAVVLNAWYSAGLYTGKYLSEQSLEKRKHG